MTDERLKLPMAGAENVAPAEITAPPEVPPWRLMATLAAAGALAGLAIVLVFGWAEPRIEAHRAEALRAAIHEVLGGPDRYETLFVVDGALASDLPAGIDSTGLDRVYAGYNTAGERVGFAIAGEQPGYQDIVGLIFGYDPEIDELLGMKVLESKETPGLGDKIQKDSAFVAGFDGVVPPIVGVKKGSGAGDPSEVDMITGATISSRTVIEIINRRLATVGTMIARYSTATAAERVGAGRAAGQTGAERPAVGGGT
jgi:electron transport complex protein RnfG